MQSQQSSLTFDLGGVRCRRTPKAAQPQAASLYSSPLPLAVCPFKIVVDTREQLPYSFDEIEITEGEHLIVPTVVRGLPSGDYSIEGLESLVAVERKSLEDAYGSVTWGRDRFEREIERLNGYEAAFVVIEATWPELMNPAESRADWQNQTRPQSVEGTIAAWSIRYPRVHWWLCGPRREAEKRTFSILRKFWQEQGSKWEGS